jgi:hypothetical protein
LDNTGSMHGEYQKLTKVGITNILYRLNQV